MVHAFYDVCGYSLADHGTFHEAPKNSHLNTVVFSSR